MCIHHPNRFVRSLPKQMPSNYMYVVSCSSYIIQQVLDHREDCIPVLQILGSLQKLPQLSWFFKHHDNWGRSNWISTALSTQSLMYYCQQILPYFFTFNILLLCQLCIFSSIYNIYWAEQRMMVRGEKFKADKAHTWPQKILRKKVVRFWTRTLSSYVQ